MFSHILKALSLLLYTTIDVNPMKVLFTGLTSARTERRVHRTTNDQEKDSVSYILIFKYEKVSSLELT